MYSSTRCIRAEYSARLAFLVKATDSDKSGEWPYSKRKVSCYRRRFVLSLTQITTARQGRAIRQRRAVVGYRRQWVETRLRWRVGRETAILRRSEY
jgi:hypothetical protein